MAEVDKKRLYSESKGKWIQKSASDSGDSDFSFWSEEKYEGGSAVQNDRYGLLGDAGSRYAV